MCGIVGFASLRPKAESESGWLDLGRERLHHRGPDGAGTWRSEDKRVGLAHRRLSIIDLSENGAQPMISRSKRFVITFNGEIYNYLELRSELQRAGVSFQSHSDTEVLLAALEHWGVEAISKFNGMFSFAIYDQAANRIILARDRAGEKPLFYRLTNDEIRFASELKALFVDASLERRIDLEALDCFLALGYVPGERCIWKGANKLPPAHALVFDCKTGDSKIWRYWTPPEQVDSELSLSDLIEQLDHLLESSVRRQLVADVPVGVLLSGGVDSSLVAAMASRVQPRIRTFTVGNPGSVLDETEYARLISRHFGTDHTELPVGEIRPELLVQLAEQFDEPLNDSSMIPTYLVCELIRKECTVALGGDGGDELFGGYRSHDRMALLQTRFGFLPNIMRKSIGIVSTHLLADGVRGKDFLLNLSVDPSSGIPMFSGQFSLLERYGLLKETLAIPQRAEAIRFSRIPKCFDAVQRVTRFDFENYMAEDILVKVDRASMLTSLEVRSPFLDKSVIEFAFRDVPSRLKATSNSRKILPKLLAKRLLPSQFDSSRKQGFGVPIGRWLQLEGPWRQLAESALLDRDCAFSSSAVKRLMKQQRSNLKFTSRLFGLLVFEIWRNRYGFSL